MLNQSMRTKESTRDHTKLELMISISDETNLSGYMENSEKRVTKIATILITQILTFVD